MKTLETPCYVIHKKELEEGIALLKSALEKKLEQLYGGLFL